MNPNVSKRKTYKQDKNMGKKIQVTLGEIEEVALEDMQKQRPNIRSQSALVREIIFQWKVGREDGSKSAALTRIEEKLEEIKSIVTNK